MKRTMALIMTTGALLSSGCQMAPKLEAPSPYTWEFGKRLGLDHKSMGEQRVGGRDAAIRALHWPARVAVVRVEKETNYMPVSQDEWDATFAGSEMPCQ